MAHRRRRRRRPSGPTQITAKLTIPFVGEISGTWEPADAERSAAWELYLELVTRVSVEELGREEGLLREALSSMYTFFTTTREILRRYGPEVAPPLSPGHVSFGVLAVTVLNRVLRPLLGNWHPRLTAHESGRPEGSDPVAWEREWEHADALRTEIAAVRGSLTSLARTLQEVAGVSDLINPAGAPAPRSSGPEGRRRTDSGYPPPEFRGLLTAPANRGSSRCGSRTPHAGRVAKTPYGAAAR
ncbi:hypothetical protein AB0L75_12170 [Streptomyces sp. NPDC052101]|uniref:hypothetical protein n=1 Tax=Streptomyces sp. NPDC052101 TaxID=3155763 RepID=UPI0034479FBD